MTAEPLALKYRPRTFPELVGQKPVQVVLLGMLHDPNPSREPLFTPKAEPDIPPVMLFAGTHGSGKTSTARIVAAALNCEGQGDLGLRPCGKCQSCDEAFAGASVDILEIDAASNGTVAEVRALKEQVSYQNGSRYKVVLLDEAHSMSKEAFNATLKLLEEPPERTVFILLTTEPGKILETVASRCVLFSFRRIAPEFIRLRLGKVCESEGLETEPGLLDLLAERADGAMRDALMLLDQCARAGVTSPEKFWRLHGETDFAPALVASMADGDFAAVYEASDRLLADTGDVTLITGKLVACLKDVLVLLSGGKLTAMGVALDARQSLARRITARQAVALLEVLWLTRTRVRLADARSNLEMALAVGISALGARIPDTLPTNGHQPGDFAELQRISGF